VSTSIAKFSQDLRRLKKTVAQEVARAAAPVLTSLALQTFEASQNPWGNLWAPGSDGKRVTLRKSGALASKIKYVSNGTKLRVALGVAYARYQIGKRPVFPTQGGRLPAEYSRALERTAVKVVRREMGR
jgi:hypothetical protein